jgi:polyisoprenyl-phosphate glycosyltransferase
MLTPAQKALDLSVVIPILNEEGNIPTLLDRLIVILNSMQIYYELIFVDDGSTDSSLHLIKDLARQYSFINFISLSRNFGHQIALSAGLDKSYGNAVLIIDADLQDSPELIPQLYLKMKEGYDVVYAIRKERKGESILKKATAKIYYRFLNRLSNVQIPLDTGDFRIMTQRVVKVIRSMPEKNKFLRGQIAWVGFKQSYIEYHREERNNGNTKFTFRKMLRLAIDGITSFSDTPLKMASALGFMVSGFAFIIMIYALYARFILNNYVQGWTSIILCVLFLGGVQLICVGVIGEYIARILSNVRGRPLYIIDDTSYPSDEDYVK